MASRKPTVFFAIPCGDFYSIQHDIITQIAGIANIEPIIAEDDPQTKELWDKICEQIQSADFFMADISSQSPNILLELGYAIKERGIRKVGIFISANASVPSDLNGVIRQQYSSFADFSRKLINWLCHSIPLLDSDKFSSLSFQRADFSEDFKDQDSFLRRWSMPPGGSYLLTHVGLRFGYAHFPILTTTLAIIQDYEFEFCARINRGKIGWVVKGTKPLNYLIPVFCVMFNLDPPGGLTPHIWNMRHPHPSTAYQVFPSQDIPITIGKNGWFTLITRVQGDIIEIEQNQQRLFRADFSEEPYKDVYLDFPQKQGQVGFRCHPDEEATIKYVRVREL